MTLKMEESVWQELKQPLITEVCDLQLTQNQVSYSYNHKDKNFTNKKN
jgi:hypothetical protein